MSFIPPFVYIILSQDRPPPTLAVIYINIHPTPHPPLFPTLLFTFTTINYIVCISKKLIPRPQIYNKTTILWTTHNPRGLSGKDLEMATICDLVAKDMGEIVENLEQQADTDTPPSSI